MHLFRITTCDNRYYKKAMELYAQSFPPHEQRKSVSQKDIMSCEEYHFNLLLDQEELVGILLCWETDDFIYVEHFCIDPEKRNRRYGQKALELLNGKGKTVILEIDPPTDEISLRRKAFYERSQYKANGFLHVHPPYREGSSGHPLTVMSYPDCLSQSDYEGFRCYLYETVMNFNRQAPL